MQDLSTLISVEDLASYLNDGTLRVIDCRFTLDDPGWGQACYADAHIPGAVYAHLDKDLSGPLHARSGRHPLPEPDRFKDTLDAWGIRNDDRIVVYDQAGGSIAARAWWLMRWVGHRQVAVLDGGWKAWQNAGQPVTTDQPVPAGSDYTIRLRNDLRVEAETITKWRESAGYAIVDSRTHDRYTGENEPIDAIAGHIPGAINIPFPGNIDADGIWKDPAELRERFQRLTKPDRTIFYCGSGVTACHNVLAFKHAGLGDALLYPGSWSEWIRDSHRPVTTGEE